VAAKVIAKTIPDITEPTLSGVIRRQVVPESVIYTDELASYGRIPFLGIENGKPLGYRHRHVKHGAGEYVYKDIHTNSVEGFWVLVKTGIRGVYHSVSPKYLQSYLDEYTFPFNRRQMGNQQFGSILERALLKAT
jgi:hypothetical protein